MCLKPPYLLDVGSANTWPARVVLAVQPNNAILVKILGQFTTLMSMQRISWLNQAPHAWNRVRVHIPPDAIHVMHRFPGHSKLHPRLLRVMARTPETDEWKGGALNELHNWSLDNRSVERALRNR